MFDVFPQLETKRFILRQIRPSDAPAIFAYFSDPEVTRYYDQPTYTSIEQAEKLLENMNKRFQEKVSLRWGITRREDDELIGTCGYNGWVRHTFRASIGYELARSFWGQKVMTEVLTAVLPFGFEQLHLNRIEAYIVPGNIASMKLVEKLGFQNEGLLREHSYWLDAFHDLYLFALLKRDWKYT